MTPVAYYNEFDPFAAAWLRELIYAGHIAYGVVDDRSIEDVRPSELAGFTQCHFFAGIGGWSYALRLAGWPDNRPVWTGSCPCQPFSKAGRGAGFADERHLWPAFFHIIQQCRPSVVFGEQVAGKPGAGWIELAASDLENAGYAFGAANIGAHSHGAPHIRQRFYWVAHDHRRRCEIVSASRLHDYGQAGHDVARRGASSGMGDAREHGAGEHARELSSDEAEHAVGGTNGNHASLPAGPTSYWGNAVYIDCQDGRARPIEPGSFPLAHGVPNRVGKLRGYGNAIVAPLAAAFIQAAQIKIGSDTC